MNTSLDKLRRRARKLGLRIIKSRTKNTHLNDRGGYQVIDTWSNTVVDGPDYDCSPSEVLAAVERYEVKA